jgi:hypothetical protein
LGVASVLGEQKMELYHRRFNHISEKAIIEAYRLRKLDIPIERAMLSRRDFKGRRCTECGLGKPNRHHYSRHRDPDDDDQHMPRPYERGHCIVMDSHEFPSEPDLVGNNKRFNFTDVASGEVWSYAAKSYTDFPSILSKFKRLVVDGPSGFRWLRFHSDSAKGFLSADCVKMLTDWRVEQTSSPADQTEMNGVAEQTNLDLGEATRVVLRTSGLPKSFWGFAYDSVIFVRRLLPRKTARGWTSPYQFATGFEPDVSHLRVWGSKTYRNLPRQEVEGKLDDRAHIGFLVGYSTLPVGYSIWDTAKQKVFVTTDAVFDEDIPKRSDSYYAEIDAVFKVVPSRVELSEFQWLKGTTHVDDENGVLYRTKAIEIRVFKHQPYVVGRRAVELADGSSGPLERDWIYAGDLVKMTEATPGFVPPVGHPNFDGSPRKHHSRGLISQSGDFKQQLPGPAGFGLETKGVLPMVAVNPDPPDDIPIDLSDQSRTHRRRKSPVNHEAKRSRKKPSVTTDANLAVDPIGRVLRSRVNNICVDPKPSCRNMTVLLICSSLFSDNERMCAAAVNLGGGLRPLPRNRRDSESGPYASEWGAAVDDELENIRSRDVRYPLEEIPLM